MIFPTFLFLDLFTIIISLHFFFHFLQQFSFNICF